MVVVVELARVIIPLPRVYMGKSLVEILCIEKYIYNVSEKKIKSL